YPINGTSTPAPTQRQFSAVMPPDIGPAVIRERGLIDSDGDLIAIAQAEPIEMPSPGPNAVSVTLGILATFNNADYVRAIVDLQGFVQNSRKIIVLNNTGMGGGGELSEDVEIFMLPGAIPRTAKLLTSDDDLHQLTSVDDIGYYFHDPLSVPKNAPFSSHQGIVEVSMGANYFIKMVWKAIDFGEESQAHYHPQLGWSGWIGVQFKEPGKGLSTNDYNNDDFALVQQIPYKANQIFEETELNKKVDKEAGKGLSANDFTNSLKTKLEGLKGTHWRGVFTSKEALDAGVSNPVAVDYAYVDAGVGHDAERYIWDSNDNKWVAQASATGITAAQVKQMYESNPDTNAFTDTEKQAVGTIGNKVDKVVDKGLSTNDYTDDEKLKLEKIEEEANKTNIVQEFGNSESDGMSQEAVSEELSTMLAFNQTWQNVKSQRSAGTIYTNQTGWPIVGFVSTGWGQGAKEVDATV